MAYAQPPLAFYQKVIERCSPKKVFLVFEDMGNPVITPLAEHATLIGVEVETVSGSLRSDIEFLLRGAVLVAGRGSFMCGITALSRHARKVYYFDSLYNDWGKPGLEIIRAFDVEGEYRDKVLTVWNNTAEQNELMLRYPLNHIAL